MSITAVSALWFLPFVAPICFYIMFTDMKAMRIPNHAVVAMFVIYVIVGAVALPLEDYLWRYLHLVVVLIAGIALNAGGALGAGDAKFAAAAAPFVHLADLSLMLILFGTTLLAAFVAHRAAKFSGLRKLAPDWDSWNSGAKFPMGLALGGTMLLYLGFGAIYGA